MSEKEHKLQMPEECMLCSRIIDCMAKENKFAKGKTQKKKRNKDIIFEALRLRIPFSSYQET